MVVSSRAVTWGGIGAAVVMALGVMGVSGLDVGKYATMPISNRDALEEHIEVFGEWKRSTESRIISNEKARDRDKDERIKESAEEDQLRRLCSDGKADVALCKGRGFPHPAER